MTLDDKINDVKTPLQWATSLSQTEVAGQVRRLSVDILTLNSEERKAILTVAADLLQLTQPLPRRAVPNVEAVTQPG